jgi:hypothetical protein
MAEEKTVKHIVKDSGGMGGAVYCMGFIGALIYYLQSATSFTDGFFGVLKAIVWPGFLVYELLQFLKM